VFSIYKLVGLSKVNYETWTAEEIKYFKAYRIIMWIKFIINLINLGLSIYNLLGGDDLLITLLTDLLNQSHNLTLSVFDNIIFKVVSSEKLNSKIGKTKSAELLETVINFVKAVGYFVTYMVALETFESLYMFLPVFSIISDCVGIVRSVISISKDF